MQVFSRVLFYSSQFIGSKKKLFFVFGLFCVAFTYAQVPDYFANDPKWVCGSWNSDQWNAPSIPYTSTNVYYLNGDTTIGNNTYRKLYSRGETTYSGPPPTEYFDYFTGNFLRQDNRSIWIYSNHSGTEKLLVSYDYEVGDTVKGDIFNQCGYKYDTIQKIDSILIGSDYRKVFYLDFSRGPVVIEGIGHQSEINGSTGGFIRPLCQSGIGFDYYIYCFALGSQSYWNSSGVNGSCDLNVSVEEYKQQDFTIYPNPFDDKLNVNSGSNLSYEVLIYDINGKQLINQLFRGERQFITSEMQSGIYFYEVKHMNRLIHSGKVIKK